jgi:hypothetical protein
MLRVYISCAQADRPYLDRLLQWLRPLEQKYFLQTWHHSAPLSGTQEVYQWDDMLDNLQQAHIYLFLTSKNSLGTDYIEREEVSRAVARHTELGEKYVRVLPIQVSPSNWSKASGLSRFKPVGGAKTLLDWKSDPMGFQLIIAELQRHVEELRRNWMEEYYRTGLPMDDFFHPMRLPTGPPVLKPIPGWAGAVFLFVIFYMVTSWYLSGCAPRMYHWYVPESLPYQSLPEQFFRDNPVEPPKDVHEGSDE